MDTGLKGKNVLITGASRNMGSASALAFAGEGANRCSENASYITGQCYLVNGGKYFQ